MKTCAFTGHRQLNYAHLNRLPELLYSAISHAYDLGCRTFIAGGAIGFDTEAARQVIRFRLSHPDVSLMIYIPFIDQAQSWNESQRRAYNHILFSANEVKYISEAYDSDCMRRRNQAMADDCDLLIAYLSNSRSGAGQTVRMAERQGKEVRNLYTELEISHI